MAKVSITGSSDGLGLVAGRFLADNGHAVLPHARRQARAEVARAALPEAGDVLVGVSTLSAVHDVARQDQRLQNCRDVSGAALA